MAAQVTFNKPNKIKILFIGDSGVGKSSLFKLFDTHEVIRNPTATLIIERRLTNIVLPAGNQDVELDVHDTPGSERFDALVRQYYRDADIVILTYDITRLKTFQRIGDYWIKEVRRYCGNDKIKMLLIGNKIDMEKNRQVTSHDAHQYRGNNDDIVMFFETSAHKGEHFSILYDALLTISAQVMAEGGSWAYRQQGEEEAIHLNDEPEQEEEQQQPERKCPC